MKRRLRMMSKEGFQEKLRSLKPIHWAAIGGGFFLVLILLLGYWITRDLPSLTQLEHFEPRLVTKVYSADSVLIKEFYTQRRDYVPLKQIPKQMQWAIIDVEDKRFFRHWGMDLKRLAKAAFVDLIHLARLQGASTLTMQLARDLYFTKKKVFIRKIREIITAIQIERTYSKPEILEMYLNHIYFGHGNYGIKSAAEYYFNKDVQDLTLEECALLAAIVNVPAYYSPIKHPDRALKRRNLVLYLMYKNGHITREEFERAVATPIQLGKGGPMEDRNIAPYFTEWIRQKLEDKFGSDLYTGGYKIYTTLDTRVQACAERAVKKQLARLQELVNRRFRNPDKFKWLLEKYVQDPVKREEILADPAKRDSLIQSKAAVQVALVAINPRNGHILAMVGGRDFRESKFNRAVQAKRQPGSAFKPFIYTAVIDNGYPPTYEVLNQPVVLFLPDGKRWVPRNFNRDQGGPTPLREALRRSLNLVSIRILQEIVKPSVVVDYAHRMGITTELRAVDALALGTSEVIPLEITSAYGIFANKGLWAKPIAITRIVNRYGEVVYQETPEIREVLSAQTAYIMANMLETVVNRGTGVTARTIYKFMRPAGGKTGTTDEYTDAWFVGFTPQITAGVWVGLDDPSISLGPNQTGAVAALPIWAMFMKAAHDTLQLPVEDFEMPPGVVKRLICDETKKLATEFCPHVSEETFREETAPTEYCDVHTGKIQPKTRKKRRRIIF